MRHEDHIGEAWAADRPPAATFAGPANDTKIGAVIDTVVVSQVRFLRECLRQLLSRDPAVRAHADCATLAHTLATAQNLQPELILLDAAFPSGVEAAQRLRAAVPASRIVVFAVPETEEAVLAWAEAGVAGYVPDTASLDDLSGLLRGISWGEQPCSSRVAAALMRRVAEGPWTARGAGPGEPAALTTRERGILRLLSAGLTNKEIARRLDIGIGTAKSHVHSILGKLQLTSRSQVAARMNRIHTSGFGAAGYTDDF